MKTSTNVQQLFLCQFFVCILRKLKGLYNAISFFQKHRIFDCKTNNYILPQTLLGRHIDKSKNNEFTKKVLNHITQAK